MKKWHKSAAYKKALQTLLIPIFVSTEEAMKWGSDLNAKDHSTLLRTQRALSNTAQTETNLGRKIILATQSQLMREAAAAFMSLIGENAKESAIDYAKARAKYAHGEIRVLKDDGSLESVIQG